MWNDLLHYFQTLEQRPLERMAMLVGGLLVFWIIEGAIPLLPLKYKKNKLRHAGVNFVFTVIHLIIHTGLAVIIVLLSDWCRDNGFGLVYWFSAGILLTICLLYTSDAADERSSVDLGGRRIIKKKHTGEQAMSSTHLKAAYIDSTD